VISSAPYPGLILGIDKLQPAIGKDKGNDDLSVMFNIAQ
jgi:hypothetical protein